MNKTTVLTTTKFFIVMASLLFVNCGRKNNSFLTFDETKKEPKINKLTLPIVKGVKIVHANEKELGITWQAIDLESLEQENDSQENIPSKTFLGYAVYRFARSAFIPKKPLPNERNSHIKNGVTTTNTFFNDTRYRDVFEGQGTREPETDPICYTIRPVFKIGKKNLEGPTSKIVCALP